ncbi:glucose 1-dehydrogenase [Steroidobacter sp. S1-65]|uniref:Glucose 1-dehydrogenase n=1 Tax=Steroidobacter gossypii TaxID=2805490 RepID=A0ABS1X2A4_9GAMM|nr:glucose 1-dehydrogenase [Steroidobacter gossypii]MBM0107364.1 glucose 1-dehydrogenase [Steroidobacter gossypii]
MKLRGQVAIVTGGSRGIGAAVARRLARDGAAVALIYQSNVEAATQVAADIGRHGGRAATFQADVTDEHAVKAAVAQIAAEFGPVNVLAHIAGVFDAAGVGEITRDLFDRQFLINTWSVITTTQATLGHFAPEGGSIINVSTSLVHEPRAGTAVYSASKAALETLTLGFATELGARNIRVNAVAPAITRTDMTADIPQPHLDHERSLTPLGRLAEPDDIADVVAFVASHDARWITGRTLLTDGGRM